MNGDSAGGFVGLRSIDIAAVEALLYAELPAIAGDVAALQCQDLAGPHAANYRELSHDPLAQV